MNKINIKTLNFNLIRVLYALLEDANVSKAAERLHLTQPAVSHSLHKLRDIFDDKILLRTTQGMELTTKAQLLKPEVKRVIAEIQNLFSPEIEFDPRVTKHIFKIGLVGEFGDYAILPKLMEWIDQNNSSIMIEVQHMTDSSAIEALEESNIDIAIGHINKHPKSIKHDILLTSSFSCVVKKDHPLAKIKKPNKKQYLQYAHIHTSYHESIAESEYVKREFEKLGIVRRIQLSVDTRTCLPKVLQNTSMIATVANGYANMLVKNYGLHTFPCPYSLPNIQIKLCQHKRTLSDDAIRWLIQGVKSPSYHYPQVRP